MTADYEDELPRLGDGWDDVHTILTETHSTGDPLPDWASDASEYVQWAEKNLPLQEEDLGRIEDEITCGEWMYCASCGEPYEVRVIEDETPTEYRDGADIRGQATLVVWCDTHAEDGEHFSYVETWYD